MKHLIVMMALLLALTLTGCQERGEVSSSSSSPSSEEPSSSSSYSEPSEPDEKPYSKESNNEQEPPEESEPEESASSSQSSSPYPANVLNLRDSVVTQVIIDDPGSYTYIYPDHALAGSIVDAALSLTGESRWTDNPPTGGMIPVIFRLRGGGERVFHVNEVIVFYEEEAFGYNEQALANLYSLCAQAYENYPRYPRWIAVMNAANITAATVVRGSDNAIAEITNADTLGGIATAVKGIPSQQDLKDYYDNPGGAAPDFKGIAPVAYGIRLQFKNGVQYQIVLHTDNTLTVYSSDMPYYLRHTISGSGVLQSIGGYLDSLL